MNTVYLLTGGNVGNREQYLRESAVLVERTCGKIVRRSALYETGAWGKTDQAAFLNQAMELSTLLNPDDLMHALLEVEKKAGRVRTEQYGPRTVDIDILLYNQSVIHSPTVTIPHMRMAERRFVLEPLNELAPHYVHPVLHKTIAQLLAVCTDKLPVKKFSA